MTSTSVRPASPVASGGLAGLVCLATSVALVIVPALAAQLAATRSTATSLDAILLGLNVVVLGHGGDTVLSTGVVDGGVTLTPLGLMIVFILVVALLMRRVGRRLDLVEPAGGLRARALRDAGLAMLSLVAVHAAGLGVMAELGRGTLMAPVTISAVVSGGLVALAGGLTGLAAAVRRRGHGDVPAVRILELLPAPFDALARATLIAVIGLLCLGVAAVCAMLVLRFRSTAGVFEQLDPGVVGGLVLTLLQLVALPLLVIWALVVLLGGTVTFGTGTGLSLDGFETGVMPLFPLLGALPDPGAAPDIARGLMLLPAVPIALGAVRLVKDVRELELRTRVLVLIGYPVLVIVVMLLLAGLATGGIGEGRLAQLGPLLNELVLPLALVVALSAAAMVGIVGTPLIPSLRDGVTRLRERVESAEGSERDEGSEREGNRDAPGDGGSEREGNRDAPGDGGSERDEGSERDGDRDAPGDDEARG